MDEKPVDNRPRSDHDISGSVSLSNLGLLELSSRIQANVSLTKARKEQCSNIWQESAPASNLREHTECVDPEHPKVMKKDDYHDGSHPCTSGLPTAPNAKYASCTVIKRVGVRELETAFDDDLFDLLDATRQLHIDPSHQEQRSSVPPIEVPNPRPKLSVFTSSRDSENMETRNIMNAFLPRARLFEDAFLYPSKGLDDYIFPFEDEDVKSYIPSNVAHPNVSEWWTNTTAEELFGPLDTDLYKIHNNTSEKHNALQELNKRYFIKGDIFYEGSGLFKKMPLCLPLGNASKPGDSWYKRTRYSINKLSLQNRQSQLDADDDIFPFEDEDVTTAKNKRDVPCNVANVSIPRRWANNVEDELFGPFDSDLDKINNTKSSDMSEKHKKKRNFMEADIADEGFDPFNKVAPWSVLNNESKTDDNLYESTSWSKLRKSLETCDIFYCAPRRWWDNSDKETQTNRVNENIAEAKQTSVADAVTSAFKTT